MNLPELLSSSFLFKNKTLSTLFLVIGLLWTAQKSFRIILQIIRSVLKNQRNLLNRYGHQSYALVTGASDGIGRSFCLQLAKRGFNICLVARTKSKLEKVQEEIKLLNPNVQTKIVIADFKNSNQEKFFDHIMTQIQNLDVSILVNNVGVDVFEEYHNIDEQHIKDLITINCLPMAILSKRLIPFMQIRKNRSAIINVASMAGYFVSPYYNVYGGSKAFNDFFSRALAEEYPQLDIISLRPSEVSTQMTFRRPTDFFTISADECVEGCLKDVGNERVTFGSWRHNLQAILYKVIPYSVYIWGYKTLYAPEMFKERRAHKKNN